MNAESAALLPYERFVVLKWGAQVKSVAQWVMHRVEVQVCLASCSHPTQPLSFFRRLPPMNS